MTGWMKTRPAAGSRLPLRRWALAASVFVAASVSVAAWAQGHPGEDGPGHGPLSMFHGGDGGRLGWRIDHLVDGLNVTPAQRAQLHQISEAAESDLRAQHEASRGWAAQAVQIFAAPTVDATAAEALRVKVQAQHDQASKRMLQVMLDVSKVLTPEQRARLGERMKEREAIRKDRMERREHGHHEHPPQ